MHSYIARVHHFWNSLGFPYYSHWRFLALFVQGHIYKYTYAPLDLRSRDSIDDGI